MTITIIIIAATVLTSILGFGQREFAYKYMFNAYSVKHEKKYYRLITHAFLHADWSHLTFNMLTLYFFGRITEECFSYISDYGGIIYIALYLSAAVASTIPDLHKHKENPSYYSLGASGAISAALFSAILFDPTMKIFIFFIPFGIPAYIFAPLYLIYCQWMSKRAQDNIGHSAHFWGAVYGIIFTVAIVPRIIPYFIDQIIAR